MTFFIGFFLRYFPSGITVVLADSPSLQQNNDSTTDHRFSRQYIPFVPRIPSSSEKSSAYIHGPFVKTPEDGKFPAWSGVDSNGNLLNRNSSVPFGVPGEYVNGTVADQAVRAIAPDIYAADEIQQNPDTESTFDKVKNVASSFPMAPDDNKSSVSDVFIAQTDAELKKDVASISDDLSRRERLLAVEEAQIVARRNSAKVADDAQAHLFSGYKRTVYEKPKSGDNNIVYRATNKQIKAEKMKFPDVPDVNRMYWKFQVTPPNISQASYHLSNTHLSPVVFQNEIDSSAFSLTKNKDDLSSFRAMLRKVSSVNIQTLHGNTMLLYSIVYGNHDALIVLLQHGAKINLCNDFLVSPLHLASYTQNHVAIAILLDYGATVNDIDLNGMTPLMYSVMRQDKLAVEFLVEYGANIDFVNEQGIGAISIAEEYGNVHIINYLKENSFNFRLFKND